jgi:hypothetical protein
MLGFGLKPIFETALRNPTLKTGQMWHDNNHLASLVEICAEVGYEKMVKLPPKVSSSSMF